MLRNRVAALHARNKRRVWGALTDLANRIGFRLAPGFTEQVVFRELFLSGLTLLDLRERGIQTPLTMSHVAGRQEVRALINSIGVREAPAPAAVPTALPAGEPVAAAL